MQSNETADSLTSFVNYTSKGGRVFLTHFSYTWLYQNGGYATAGTWQVNQANPGSPLIANIDTATSKGKDFASWLGLVGALSASHPPQIAINDPRRNLNAVPPGQGGQRWIYSDDPPVVQQMVVETPITAHPDNLCGRVIYSDFHVANAMNGLLTFPAECTTADFTAQERPSSSCCSICRRAPRRRRACRRPLLSIPRRPLPTFKKKLSRMRDAKATW
jgi:hypothetical protein